MAKPYQRYHVPRTDKVGEVSILAGNANIGEGAPSAAMSVVPDARAAIGEVTNPVDAVDTGVVHGEGALIDMGETTDSTEAANATACAPSNSTLVLLGGGALSAAEAKEIGAVTLLDRGASTATEAKGGGALAATEAKEETAGHPAQKARSNHGNSAWKTSPLLRNWQKYHDKP